MTPTGLLQKGDVLVAQEQGETRRYRVIKRLGNDEIYAVRVVPADDLPLPPRWRSTGYMLMTEVPYWLKHGLRVE